MPCSAICRTCTISWRMTASRSPASGEIQMRRPRVRATTAPRKGRSHQGNPTRIEAPPAARLESRLMRKIFVFLALLPAALFAQQQDFSKVQMKVTKITDSVYMLTGAGGNIGVCVGEDGIVIVDD